MAGPIQSAVSGAINTAAGAAVAIKKGVESEKQAEEKATAMAEAEKQAKAAQKKEVADIALEADLIRMGADPKSAESYMAARALGLETKGFGMVRNKKGKFVGSYSSIAEKLSKDSLTDSLSSRALNDEGFTARVLALGGDRKKKVQTLIEASKGGKR